MTLSRLIVLVLVLVAGCAVTGPSASDTPRPRDGVTSRSGSAGQPPTSYRSERPEPAAPQPTQRGSPEPRPDDSAAASPDSPSAPPSSRQPTVKREVAGWWAWALLDRRTGKVRGSPNRTTDTTSTESMVKAWLVADYLATAAKRGRTPSPDELSTMSSAIRVSDNDAADQLYFSLGGETSIRRMISTCGLTGSRPYGGTWSLTQVTARDAATLGDCLADGAVAGPRWTAWLLAEMRGVVDSNAFGIRQGFPPADAARIAVKNGWTPREDGQWHVACLGVWHNWSLAVLVRYPTELGLPYGAAVCRDVTRQLFR